MAVNVLHFRYLGALRDAFHEEIESLVSVMHDDCRQARSNPVMMEILLLNFEAPFADQHSESRIALYQRPEYPVINATQSPVKGLYANVVHN